MKAEPDAARQGSGMGIYDRDYYRDDSRWRSPWTRSFGTIALAVVLTAVFVAQLVIENQDAMRLGPLDDPIIGALQLDVEQTIRGEVWRLVSYAFAHSSDHIWQFIFNLLVLLWIGRRVEDLYGSREYSGFVLVATLLGGVAYTVVGTVSDRIPPLLSPVGTITAILVLFGLHFPGARLLFLPAWLFVILYAAWDVVGMTAGRANPARIAVHLAGAAFAYVYHGYSLRVLAWLPTRRGQRRPPRTNPARLRVRQPEPEPAAAAASAIPGGSKPAVTPGFVDEHLEAKLDEVLAKVAQSGKDSLTAGELEILRKASEIYKRRRLSS